MKKPRLFYFVLAAGVVVASSVVLSNETQATSRPQVMLIGSHHLANNNRDLINLPIENVLTSRRQREIQQLVANLARWRPTRVAIEWDRSDQRGLDRRYADFLTGELELTANERDQIGFRLAKSLGHKEIYAVDWNETAPGDQAQYDFIGWAKRNGHGARFKAFVEKGQEEADRTAATMRRQSIGQWYYDLNSPEAREDAHRPYFEIATFGSNHENPGAAWVGAWYARNLRIFNNIRQILEPNDRVLVLYGSGHIYLLDRFLREREVAVAVDPRRYIRGQ